MFDSSPKHRRPGIEPAASAARLNLLVLCLPLKLGFAATPDAKQRFRKRRSPGERPFLQCSVLK